MGSTITRNTTIIYNQKDTVQQRQITRRLQQKQRQCKSENSQQPQQILIKADVRGGTCAVQNAVQIQENYLGCGLVY